MAQEWNFEEPLSLVHTFYNSYFNTLLSSHKVMSDQFTWFVWYTISMQFGQNLSVREAVKCLAQTYEDGANIFTSI